MDIGVFRGLANAVTLDHIETATHAMFDRQDGETSSQLNGISPSNLKMPIVASRSDGHLCLQRCSREISTTTSDATEKIPVRMGTRPGKSPQTGLELRSADRRFSTCALGPILQQAVNMCAGSCVPRLFDRACQKHSKSRLFYLEYDGVSPGVEVV